MFKYSEYKLYLPTQSLDNVGNFQGFASWLLFVHFAVQLLA